MLYSINDFIGHTLTGVFFMFKKGGGLRDQSGERNI